MAYPKWIYHATQPARIVASESERLALGPGWAESPGEALEIDPLAAQLGAPADVLEAAPRKRGRPRKAE